MAETDGYGWIHEMATGKLKPPRTDVTGACTAAKARKTMPCTTAIARIDCWVSEAAGCVKGLKVAYHNPNQVATLLCDTGTSDAPAASLSLASGEVILTLVPRAQRALLRASFPGSRSTCITRLVATTSAGRTWTCDARPPSRRGLLQLEDRASAGAAVMANVSQLAAPDVMPQLSRPGAAEPSFLCNLPQNGPTCHFFRRPGDVITPLEFGIQVLGGLTMHRACWNLRCAGASARVGPPLGVLTNDTRALSEEAMIQDPETCQPRLGAGLRACIPEGYKGGGGCGDPYRNKQFLACQAGSKPFGTAQSFATDTVKNLARVVLDKYVKLASPFIGDFIKDTLKLFWPSDPQPDQLKLLWDEMQAWVTSFVTKQIKQTLDRQRQQFLWGLFNTMTEYSEYDINDLVEVKKKRQLGATLIALLSVDEAVYLGATFGANFQSTNESWNCWDVMASYTTIMMSLLMDRVVNHPYLYPEEPNSSVPAVELLALNRRATIPTGYPSWMHKARAGATTSRVGQLSWTTASSSDKYGIIQWGDDFFCSGSAAIRVNAAGILFPNPGYSVSTYGFGCPFYYYNYDGHYSSSVFHPFNSIDAGYTYYIDNVIANTVVEQKMALDATSGVLYQIPGMLFPNLTGVAPVDPKIVNTSTCDTTVTVSFQAGGTYPQMYELDTPTDSMYCGPHQKVPFDIPSEELVSDYWAARRPDNTWRPIRNIQIWASGTKFVNARWWQVFGIQAYYGSGSDGVLGQLHGTKGDQVSGVNPNAAPWAVMTFDEDEYVTEMTACSDLLVRYLEFATNKGRRTIGGMSNTTDQVPWYPQNIDVRVYPKAWGRCESIYRLDVSPPASLNARLMYFESLKLKPLYDRDGKVVKAMYTLNPGSGKDWTLIDRVTNMLGRTYFVFGYKLTFFKGYKQNPIMICNVDVWRMAKKGNYPGNIEGLLFHTSQGRQWSGHMQCAGRPGDQCNDSVCPLPALNGPGEELDCDYTNPPTGFP